MYETEGLSTSLTLIDPAPVQYDPKRASAAPRTRSLVEGRLKAYEQPLLMLDCLSTYAELKVKVELGEVQDVWTLDHEVFRRSGSHSNAARALRAVVDTVLVATVRSISATRSQPSPPSKSLRTT